MTMMKAWLAVGACGALSACVTPAAPVAAVAPVASATADVRDRTGAPKATATATQVGGGIRLRIAAMNMPMGGYGAHIHAVGQCDNPNFESAGPHWNPTNQQHGKDNPRGMHKGDLPNLLIGSDGRGEMEITIPNASIAGAGNSLLDGDGAALVIHASADDYRSDPSGNSGARMACGVFR